MLKSSLALGPVALVSFACAISASARAASDPKGVWLNDTGRGAIEIKDCGGALCGHVVWVKDGADAKGCGKQIIGDARHSGGSTWGGGWVYSPEKKKRYDVELTPVGGDKLQVVGFAGIKLFSRTMIWKRAPDDLQRCGSTETIAKTDAPKAAPAAPVVAAPAETKSPEIKAPDARAQTAKIPEVKAPDATSRVTTARETTSVEAKAPADAPASSAQSEPSAPSQTSPTTGKEETAQAAGENDEAANEETEDPADKGKFDLGDIDVSKFLKKTRSGNCKLDLPWVKIEFGCE